MDIKEMRENFAHSNGTSVVETFAVILPSFLLVYIATVLLTFATKVSSYSTFARFIIEFVIIILPIILNITVLVDFISKISTSLVAISVAVTIFILKPKEHKTGKLKEQLQCAQKYFITNARSTINLISAICILAVDFKIFPRRFAKTEMYGFSLMDVGVGLFVYSNGIVAPEISGRKNALWQTFKTTIPLFVLGSVRFLITKEMDYHVPVSEYGVHWNFFITLAVTKILSSLIMNFIVIKYVIFNAISLLVAHEIFLQIGGADFVFSNLKRDSFLNANREGIVSTLGYVGLYFLSVSFGVLIGTRNNSKNSKSKMLLTMIVACIILLVSTYYLQSSFGISRRLANSAYCCWVMFIGVAMTTLFYLTELIQQLIYGYMNVLNPFYAPLIFEAINYNGLVFFLFANLLTGLVNILLNTMQANELESIAIIAIYVLVTCGVMNVLYSRGIKFKL